jgi:uncharacterized protein
MEKKRITIIGSGPAGIFSALELTNQKNKDLEIIILEKEAHSSGGMINDCKLNLSTNIGMSLKDLRIEEQTAEDFINYIDKKFLEHGAPEKLYGTNEASIKKLKEKAERCGLKLIDAKQRHVGTDNSKNLVESFKKELENKNVQFKNKCLVEKIMSAENERFGLIIKNNGKQEVLETDYLIVAPGRAGSIWFRKQADNLGIHYLWGPIDVGIRLELPVEFYSELTDIIYDPKIIMDAEDKEFTRTFCTNPGGRIRIESQNGEGLYLINGDANQHKKTDNTNFAILTRLYLTDPLVDTRKEGIDMAKKTNEYGGGKPIIQKLGKFFNNKRSKPSDFETGINPTIGISRVTPGDINLVYNYKIINKLKNFLERLDHLVPGVSNQDNNLYAPEIKFYETNYITDNSLETDIPRLYVAGDGVGKSRGIVGAALTGIIAAKGILKKL